MIAAYLLANLVDDCLRFVEFETGDQLLDFLEFVLDPFISFVCAHHMSQDPI